MFRHPVICQVTLFSANLFYSLFYWSINIVGFVMSQIPSYCGRTPLLFNCSGDSTDAMDSDTETKLLLI